MTKAQRCILTTYIYSMKPPYGQRRTVLGVPLEAQPVPPINHMIPSLLWSKYCRRSLLLFLLLCLLRLVRTPLGLGWRWGLGSTGA